MSPVGANFVPSPSKTGTNLLHLLSPPIVGRVQHCIRHRLEEYVRLLSSAICNYFQEAVCKLPTAIDCLKPTVILYMLAHTTEVKLLQYCFFVLSENQISVQRNTAL